MLDGKVAVITGGSTGIGYATARCFLDEGARVVIAAQDPHRLAEATRSLTGPVSGVVVDVRSAHSLTTLFEQVLTQFGALDIVFANAGVAVPAPIEGVTEEMFDDQLAVNVRGVFFTVQAALPHLREGAAIVLNASINASVGMPGLSVYSATKAAVRSFAHTMGVELAGRGIRVNSISPGAVDTPAITKIGLPADQLDAMRDGVRAQVPMGRIADPAEIAKAVLFLASDDSSYLLGSELVVDGGRSRI